MQLPTRGKRLGRRYPILASVPEEQRPAVVKAALRHPLLLLLVLGVGLLGLPPYFEAAFSLLRVEQEPNMMLKMAKLGGAVLLPIVIAVPLLTRLVMPRLLRREMLKRGFDPDSTSRP